MFGGFHGLKKTHVLPKNGGFFSEIIGLSSRSNVCALRAKNPRCATPCRARCLILISFIIYLAPTEGKKWWKYSSLLALRVQRRRSLWLIEENVVGVTEFNSSRRRLERSACGGVGGGRAMPGCALSRGTAVGKGGEGGGKAVTSSSSTSWWAGGVTRVLLARHGLPKSPPQSPKIVAFRLFRHEEQGRRNVEASCREKQEKKKKDTF